MKRIVIFLVAMMFSIGLIWAGDAREEPAAEMAKEGKYGGILTRAYFAPGNLDPAFASDITAGEICGL